MIRDKNNIVTIIKRITRLVILAEPVLFCSCLLLSISHGVLWGMVTWVKQIFFDNVTLYAQNAINFPAILLSLLWLGLISAGCQIFNGAECFVYSIIIEKINGKLSININKKISNLSAEVFEDTKRLELINKAEEGKNNAVDFVITLKDIATFYFPYFIFMGGYLYQLKSRLAISIVLVFIPVALSQIIRVRAFSTLADEAAPYIRQQEYYERCMVDREYYKETRILGGVKFFKEMFLDILASIQNFQLKATMKATRIEFFMQLLTVFGYLGILVMLFRALMAREISVGAFAAVFSSIGTLYGIMNGAICNRVGSMAQSVGTIYNFFEFMDMEERGGQFIELEPLETITLNNVSFAYPNSKENALKNINLSIKKGETLAVVGENGSGKSTLARLILGLYQPKEGYVSYNSVSTSEISNQGLYKYTSAVFQKYQKYQMTLRENIGISKADKEWKDDTLAICCDNAGIELDSGYFPEEFDTMLSREFNGIELSGGEWQRIAIGRAYFRDHTLIVLDEPTAAIDPYEEKNVYIRFSQIVKDKTAIIVTHRLASVRFADRIIVMKNGRIKEIGTHDELIHRDTEYRRLYLTQKQWYIENMIHSKKVIW